MLDIRLYLLQRLSALVMIPLVIGHIATMIWAIHGGLTAAEILSRTRGSVLWAAWYGAFVLAAATHAAIGVRVIAFEWFGVRRELLGPLGMVLFGIFVALGYHAVKAVVAP
jgi:fumarate reductase subunit C